MTPRKSPPLPVRARDASRPRSGPGLDRLLEAVLRDDRVQAGKCLKENPALAREGLKEARLYQTAIIHWLYVNDTPLHLAAAGQRLEIARLLLKAGADVNAASNHRRGSPLHYAADGNLAAPAFDEARQVKTIELLLKEGADLQAADKNGATALHRAVRSRSAAAVECLLRAGADPAARNLPGATPFHLAVQNTGKSGSGDAAAKEGQRRIIAAMLKHGVSPSLKDARGKSVLDWARSDWVRGMLLP